MVTNHTGNLQSVEMPPSPSSLVDLWLRRVLLSQVGSGGHCSQGRRTGHHGRQPTAGGPGHG